MLAGVVDQLFVVGTGDDSATCALDDLCHVSLLTPPTGCLYSGLDSMTIPRIYLTGRLAIETREGLIVDMTRSSDVTRVGLAVLVLERHRPVALDEMADAIWEDQRPKDWQGRIDKGLEWLEENLDGMGIGEMRLERGNDPVRLILPSDVWVDLEHAHRSLERAEAAMCEGDLDTVVVKSTTAAVIGKRPFLPGLESRWISSRRTNHRANLIDGLVLRARAALRSGAADEAVRIARQVLAHDPLHEPALQVLMRSLNAVGNRVDALREYEEYRVSVAKHPGTTPTQETEALAAELRAPSVADVDALTPRQGEVALLLAEGLTNRQIANRLFISVQTAETHVKHILTRLGLSSRSQVAALVAAQQLTDLGED